MSTSVENSGRTSDSPTVNERLASVRAVAYIGRAVRFIGHVIRMRSISLALWVDAFENHKPHHGK